MDCSLPGSSVHGIFQVGVLEWGAIAFSTLPARVIQFLLKKKKTKEREREKVVEWLLQIRKMRKFLH